MKQVLADPAAGFTQKCQKAQILCIPLIHARKYMI